MFHHCLLEIHPIVAVCPNPQNERVDDTDKALQDRGVFISLRVIDMASCARGCVA